MTKAGKPTDLVIKNEHELAFLISRIPYKMSHRLLIYTAAPLSHHWSKEVQL